MPPVVVLLAFLSSALDEWQLARAIRATVWVRAGDRAVGTGWVVAVDRRWVVTARHVLGNVDRADVFFPDVEYGLRPDRAHYIENHGTLRERGLVAGARLVKSNEMADLALLAVDRIPPGTPAMTLATQCPGPGDPCRSVGHRHDSDLLWQVTTGNVRQAGRLADGYYWAGKKLGAGAPVLLLQSPIEAGESGAAVLDRSGRAIGLISAVANRTPGTAIAIDVVALRDLLADARKDAAPNPDSGRPTEPSAPICGALRATVWVRPQATNGHGAGVLIDRDRRLVLTSASAAGTDDVIDVLAPRWQWARLVSEVDAYGDVLGLRLSGHCVRGVVLARDSVRDLALVELETVPPTLESVKVAANPLRAGEAVAAVTHPVGIDLRWLASTGTVRSVGKVALQTDPGASPPRCLAAMLQLPHQGGAAGGPVVDARGELIGILAAREGARQELAYAAAPGELRAFLDEARPWWAPRTAEEWHHRARVLKHRGTIASELAAHAEAGRLAPDDATYLAAQALALAENGQHREARAAIARAERIGKRPAAVEVLLSEAWLLVGDAESAARSAAAAVKSDPKLPGALVARARTRSGPDALRDLDEAIELDPSCAAAYRERANRHDRETAEGRDRALSDLRRAIELTPHDPQPRILRAQLHMEGKDYKKAVADCARLTELSPRTSSHWERLADAQLHKGDEAAGVTSLVAVARLEARGPRRVFVAIRSHADQLRSEHPGDARRVLEWYVRALSGIRPWVPAAVAQDIDRNLTAAGKADAARTVAAIDKKVGEWTREP